LHRGSRRLRSGPAPKPSGEIDVWQVVSGTGGLPSGLRVSSDDTTVVPATASPLSRPRPPVRIRGGEASSPFWLLTQVGGRSRATRDVELTVPSPGRGSRASR